ncbi:ankyrin repeat protein [Megavirus baoshan]|uniref:Ankyrin repeat protein n=1 Tax=Megavirus baoshan TaxID=2496520 RepID=A0A3S8UWI5_9VIRU|nr:ankyrin repeat protein [Megavirus baoshan]AZL89165.1 ankyrin repeat protein [Megavirus baoshan]
MYYSIIDQNYDTDHEIHAALLSDLNDLLENKCTQYKSSLQLVEVIPLIDDNINIRKTMVNYKIVYIKYYKIGTCLNLFDLNTIIYFQQSEFKFLLYDYSFIMASLKSSNLQLINLLLDIWQQDNITDYKKNIIMDYKYIINLISRDYISLFDHQYVDKMFIEPKSNVTILEYIFINAFYKIDNIDVLNLIYGKGIDIEPFGYQLMAIACNRNSVISIDYLMNLLSDIPDNANDILKIAATNCDINIVQHLVNIGVPYKIFDVDIVSKITRYIEIENILKYILDLGATSEARSEMFSFFLKKNTEINTINHLLNLGVNLKWNNYSCIRTCILYKHNDMAKYLIDLVETGNYTDFEPHDLINHAIFSVNIYMIDFLMDKYNLEVNIHYLSSCIYRLKIEDEINFVNLLKKIQYSLDYKVFLSNAKINGKQIIVDYLSQYVVPE